MSIPAKHTHHSMLRTLERTKVSPETVTKRLYDGDFVELPRVDRHSRAALMYENEEAFVVIYAFKTMTVVTVLELEMYAERFQPGLNLEVAKRFFKKKKEI